MENNEQNNNGDVSVEEVNKVITENGNQSQPAPQAQPVIQSVPIVATQSQQAPVVEVIPKIAAPVESVPVPQPSVNLGEQSESLPLTQQPIPESQPTPIESIPITQSQPVSMKFLQFECSACEFKTYVNLDDDKLKELPDKLKCMNCGKKKSIKRRIMDMTWHGVADYVEPEEPIEQPDVE